MANAFLRTFVSPVAYRPAGNSYPGHIRRQAFGNESEYSATRTGSPAALTGPSAVTAATVSRRMK
eukprot:scaffold228461_cov35-Tisochrysis_lutea.AAC.1